MQQCAPLVGAAGTGLTCATGTVCRSGLCIGGYCASPCTSYADCTQAGSCTQQTIAVGNLSGSFAVCTVTPCNHTAACDPGEVCSTITVSGKVATAFCRTAQAGGLPVGTSCTIPGPSCASLLCVPALSECTEACVGDADCGGDICVDVWGQPPTMVQGCAQGCARQTDCSAGDCAYAEDWVGDRIRFICASYTGMTDPAGASCSDTSIHCASGVCLKNTDADGNITSQLCTQPCVTASDCPPQPDAGPSWGCVDVPMMTPKGGSQMVKLCNKNPG